MSVDRRVKEPAQRIPGNRAAQAGRPDCARVGESEAAGGGAGHRAASAARAWESDPRALPFCKEQQLRACLSTMPHPWDERNVVWQRLGKKKRDQQLPSRRRWWRPGACAPQLVGQAQGDGAVCDTASLR